jgi:hypothetical protein
MVHNLEKIVHDGRAAETGGGDPLFQRRGQNQRVLDGVSAFGRRGNQSQGLIDSAGPTSKELDVSGTPLV